MKDAYLIRYPREMIKAIVAYIYPLTNSSMKITVHNKWTDVKQEGPDENLMREALLRACEILSNVFDITQEEIHAMAVGSDFEDCVQEAKDLAAKKDS